MIRILSLPVSLVAVPVFVAVFAPATAAAALGDCAQPVSSGSRPVASDCLFILNVAVGIGTCTPEACVCDPTGDGSTTATDALRCLAVAVGGMADLECPCSTTTTTMPFEPADCNDNGFCGADDDCVCSDCDDDLFCSDPSKCENDGACNTFTEGCVCADCAAHPECLDN